MANSKVSLFTSTDLGDYDVSMKILRKSIFPKAVADTLNSVANSVTKDQINNVKNDFTLRNKFTMRSMVSPRAKPYQALNKAGGTNLKSMFSRAGTTSPYLWMHEENYTNKARDERIPIALNRARIGGKYKRVISGKYRLKKSQSLRPGSIRFNSGSSGFIGTPKGMARRYGIYQRSGNKLFMVRNLESKTTKIKGTHFHEKAVNKFGGLRGSYQNRTFKMFMKAHMSKDPIFRKNILGS